MVSLPEVRLVLEHRLGNRGRIFPVRPLGPTLPEIDTIPQPIRSERAVGENETITAVGERSRVVVGSREHHHVVALALSKEEIVGGLIARTRQLIRIDTGNPVNKM